MIALVKPQTTSANYVWLLCHFSLSFNLGQSVPVFQVAALLGAYLILIRQWSCDVAAVFLIFLWENRLRKTWQSSGWLLMVTTS